MAGMRVKVQAILLAGIALGATQAVAAAEYHTGCVAAKVFDASLSADGDIATLSIARKPPRSETPVAGTINKVLLRSPYKSEGTALPKTEGHRERDGYTAQFDMDAIRALPAGDMNVVIITPEGEQICRIKNSARKKLVAER
jgi:hypothetical protein